MPNRYHAILFDLLTALLDSWTLWDRVAGSEEDGRRWRLRYLDLTYRAGSYRDYQSIVAEAASDAGLPESSAGRLMGRWDELEPWPEAPAVLASLSEYPLGVVTNCSQDLARRAVNRVGIRFDVLVSAQRAGAYKPDPRAYALALSELGCEAERVLFVAGSPFDVVGASRAGMPVFWHNRLGIAHEAASETALLARDSLDKLSSITG